MVTRTWNCISGCAGAGGLDLAVELAFDGRARTVCYIDRESYAAATLVGRMAQKTLAEAPVWDCIESFDGRPWRGLVDMLFAGFPCQPASVAGRRQGTDDERWIWDDLARVICDVRPELLLLENVPGLLTVNDGRAAARVFGTLAQLGYAAEWCLFSAAQMGASHRRERLFILAYADQSGFWLEQECVAGSKVPPELAAYQLALANGESRRQSELWEPSAREWRRRHADGRGKAVEHTALSKTARQPEQSVDVSGSASSDVADTESSGRTRSGLSAGPRGEGPRAVESDGRGEDVSLTAGAGLARRSDKQDGPHLLARFEYGSGEFATLELPFFPPGPNDRDQWASIIEIAPALEPAVCRVVDELAEGMVSPDAYRMDRLRVLGNGVFPLCGAIAIRVLAKRLGVTL